MSHTPIISSQRYLNPKVVAQKAMVFKVFAVRTVDVELRGKQYRILLDGHHNLAASKLAGVAPTWRGAPEKIKRIMRKTPKEQFAQMLINNLTDSDWYFVDTGEVVKELQGVEP